MCTLLECQRRSDLNIEPQSNRVGDPRACLVTTPWSRHRSSLGSFPGRLIGSIRRECLDHPRESLSMAMAFDCSSLRWSAASIGKIDVVARSRSLSCVLPVPLEQALYNRP